MSHLLRISFIRVHFEIICPPTTDMTKRTLKRLANQNIRPYRNRIRRTVTWFFSFETEKRKSKFITFLLFYRFENFSKFLTFLGTLTLNQKQFLRQYLEFDVHDDFDLFFAFMHSHYTGCNIPGQSIDSIYLSALKQRSLSLYRL